MAAGPHTSPPGEQIIALSIVIPFRGDPEHLRECLDAISKQVRAPMFETIIVDDGSECPVPSDLGLSYDFPLRVCRQTSLGISAARNLGACASSGRVVLFVDSDVCLDEDFLWNLSIATVRYPEDMAFQANLRGNESGIVGIMEDLRLSATIESLKQEDGHIAYLNTSAFAIRRPASCVKSDIFDLNAVRGEDTALLAVLLRQGKKPRLVSGAKASHKPRLGPIRYIFKHYIIGYRTQPARNQLARTRPDFLLGYSGRQGVAKHMIAKAFASPSRMPALPLIVLAYCLERLGRISHKLFGFRHGRRQVLGLPVDGVREDGMVATITSHASKGDSLAITYLTAWSMVQAKHDPSMSRALRNFDICYPDGMGVVLSSLLLGHGRIHKVTANSFIWKLLRQSAFLGLPVVLVGGQPGMISEAAGRIRAKVPTLHLAGCHHGYMSDAESAELIRGMASINPGLIIVGMGQPLQEKWVLTCREHLSHSVFLCVGGLFDYLCGLKPTPPKWIRKSGFEWLFILILRPRRFWKRYLLGLPALASLIIIAWILKFLTIRRLSP